MSHLRKIFKLFLLIVVALLAARCNEADEYYNYEKTDSALLREARGSFDIRVMQEWLEANRVSINSEILWDRAIISDHFDKEPVIIDVPVERHEARLLQRLIFTYDAEQQLIESQLWTFSSENEFLPNFDESYTMTAHDVAENFVGDLIMWDMKTNLLKKVEQFDYSTAMGMGLPSACMACHGGGFGDDDGGGGTGGGGTGGGTGGGGWNGGPIDLDEVVVTAPANDFDWWFYGWDFWDPTWGGGTIPGGGGVIIWQGGGNGGQNNHVCGGYNWKTIGNANVVNITGLGMSAQNGPYLLDAEFYSLCITMPNYNVGLGSASGVFNQAWNLTMNQVYTYLNTNAGPINSTAIKTFIKTNLAINLNTFAGVPSGSSVSTGPCNGSNTSAASYCP